VFHADRWASAFLSVTTENAESTFFCLKAFAQPVKSIRGVFFGHKASAELEAMLREGVTDITPDVEYAIRFICLLVEKDSFRFIDILLAKIEQKLNDKKGILAISLEAATPVDASFESDLTRIIKERTGASGVTMQTRVNPELLGGYRLRMGGFFIDASLKGQLADMKAELEAVI